MKYAELLGPSSRWLPLLERGVVEINRRSNRLVWTNSGQFAAALTPTSGLAEKLASVPLDATTVKSAIAAVGELASVGPALEKLQLISTIGAAASVANLGVSVVGFAVVLHRLKRIEGKLDQMLNQLGDLKKAVQSLGMQLDAFLLARLAAAHASLERALAASTERERIELARDARRGFQEARLRYLELWKRTEPWNAAEIPVPTALEIQARYAAAAVGELQAEFILGDTGAFTHVCRSSSNDIANEMALEPISAFRCRTDSAALRVGSDGHGPADQAMFISEGIDLVAAQVRLAAETTRETAQRLRAFEEDAELPALLNLPPHEVLLALRNDESVDVVALGRLEQ